MRYLLLWLAISGSLLLAAPPALTLSVVTRGTVLTVHDGDTLSLAVQGFRPFAGPVRLKGVLAVELKAKGGADAQRNLQALAIPGQVVRILWFYSSSGTEESTLGRPVVILYRESDGADLNALQAAWLQENHLWGGTGSKPAP